MIIDCISDLHGYRPELTSGDLLLIAGDLTATDTYQEYELFFQWLETLSYSKKVLIAGNHDGHLSHYIDDNDISDICDYLLDSSITYKDYKIYGSPWTPAFCNWYYMKQRGEDIKAMWDKIPLDTDILITHGPPYGVLDHVKYSSRGNKYRFAGCEELLKAVDRVKPLLHIFGHIHEEGGKKTIYKHIGLNTIMVNASVMDEEYRPVNSPMRVILEEKRVNQEVENGLD